MCRNTCRQGLEVPPTFMLQQSLWNQTQAFVARTLAGNANATFNATIDLTEIFPQGRQVRISPWPPRRAECPATIRRRSSASRSARS